jgi:Legionella pneumophila major outer membrane protein precursor
MKRKLSFKKLAAAVGAVLLAVGANAQAQVVVAQKQEIKEAKQLPAQLVESPAPAGVFDAPANTDSGFYVGVGFYLMRPHFPSNSAFTAAASTVTPVFGATTNSSSQNTDFSYPAHLAPRIFVGYTSDCGLGVRIGWWQYNQSSSAAAQLVPTSPGTPLFLSGFGLGTISNAALAPGQKDTYAFGNNVFIDVWDFDVTQRLISANQWDVTGGAGIRYTFLSQSTDAAHVVTGLPAGSAINGAVHTRSFFNVAGPDVLLEGRRHLGNGGFALYGNARGGVLFGTSRTATSASATAIPAPFFGVPTTTINSVTDHNNNLMPFMEAELGVEWMGGGSGRFQPFGKLGIVGQSWFGADNNPAGYFGMLGLSFSAGVNY